MSDKEITDLRSDFWKFMDAIKTEVSRDDYIALARQERRREMEKILGRQK